MNDLMMSVGTQVPVLRRKRPAGLGKREETGFPDRSSIITRSVQRKRSLIPHKTIKTLPNISGLVIQAIAASASENGLTFAELKEALISKGYHVRRQSPRVQRGLRTSVLKGALMRMSQGGGSKFFIIRKHQNKTPKIFGIPERTAVARKVRARKRYATRTGTKTKAVAEAPRSSAGKTGEACRKLRTAKRRSAHRRRRARKHGSARRSPRLAQKAALGSRAEGRRCSSRKASDLKGTKKLRNGREKPKRNSSKGALERPKSSKDSSSSSSTAYPLGVGNPYNKETFSAKKKRFRKSRDVSSAKEQNRKGKAAFPPRRPKCSARRGR